MLNPLPFKVAWNSNSIRTEWAPKLFQINALTSKVEYEMLKRGLIKASPHSLSPQNFDEQIKQITEDGLVYLPILRSRMQPGFNYRFSPVDQIDGSTAVYGVVAKDLEIAKEFCEATNHSDYITLGRLRGHPRCCSSTFGENWSKKIADPCYEAAVNTQGSAVDGDVVHVSGHPYLNTMLRYFGVKIAPFYPCNYKCSSAIEASKTWYGAMESLDKETALHTMEILSQPLTWSLNKGIVYVKTPLMQAVINGYECGHRKDLSWE